VSCLIGIKRRGNFSEQETVEVVRNIVRAVVTKYDNSVLIIKPHPTDFEYGVAELVQRALHGISQHKYRLLSSEDISCLVEIIKGSSLTIVNQSTAAFESIALNVPVISVIPDRILPGNDALHDGIVYTSIVAPIEHIFEQLIRTLPDCLTDRHLTDECQRHLMKFLYKNDGRSSERVMREMDEMMDRWFA
jgi:ADP-heptose:LPS heptosyltransferase